METKYLNADSRYMNPTTGSVAKGLNWEIDYMNQKNSGRSVHNVPEDENMTWEEWGGHTLIEVELVNGEWEEV